MLVTRKSPFSGEMNTREIDVTQDLLDQYYSGDGHVQDVFPNLSPDDREFILTGITPEEWDEEFNG